MPASIPDSEDDEPADLASSIAVGRMKSIDGSFELGADIGFGGTQAARENVLMPIMDSSMLWTVGQDLQTPSTCKTRRTQSSGQTVHDLPSDNSHKAKKKQKRHHTAEIDYLPGDNIIVQQPTITQELAARAALARAEDSSSLIKSTSASTHNVRHVVGVVIPKPPPAGSQEMVSGPSPSEIAESITVSDSTNSTCAASSKSSKDDNAKAMPPPELVMPTQPATPSASGSNGVATPAAPEFVMPSQPASSMASRRTTPKVSNRRAQTTIFEDHPGLAERPEPSPNLHQQQEVRKTRGRGRKKKKAPEEIPETQAESAVDVAEVEDPLPPQASSGSGPTPPSRSSQQTQTSSRKKRATTPVIVQPDEVEEEPPVEQTTPTAPIATKPTLAPPQEAKRQESPPTENQPTDRSTHSPIKRSGNALLRVGLSKRQRIQPLLKVMKR